MKQRSLCFSLPSGRNLLLTHAESVCVFLMPTEPGDLGAGRQSRSALLAPPSASAAPFLPARPSAAAPEPAKHKLPSNWDGATPRTRGASFESAYSHAPQGARVHAPRPPSLWRSSCAALPADPLLSTWVWHLALESCLETGLQWRLDGLSDFKRSWREELVMIWQTG